MKTLSLTLMTLIFSNFAHADFNLNEELQFVDQAAHQSNKIITNDPSDPTYLGRITNQSSGQSIEIDCIDGTKDACKELGFFKVTGSRDSEPFYTVEMRSFDRSLNDSKSKFRYFLTSRWIFAEGGDTTVMFFGIGEVLVVVDTLIAPFRLVNHAIEKSSYNKARKALFKALNTGATITVSENQYNRLLSILQ